MPGYSPSTRFCAVEPRGRIAQLPVDRELVADRLWASSKLQSAVNTLVERVTETAACGRGVSPEDLTARAAVLNDIVNVEHYLRKLYTCYGFLSSHRKLHTAQVVPLKRARAGESAEIGLAMKLLRDYDSL